MINEFKERNIFITDIKYCPYHPSKGKGKYLRDSIFRKPNPGMILEASEEHNIDLKQSIFVGDRLTDMQAGLSAGVGKNFLYKSKEKIAQKSQAYVKVEFFKEIISFLEDEL